MRRRLWSWVAAGLVGLVACCWWGLVRQTSRRERTAEPPAHLAVAEGQGARPGITALVPVGPLAHPSDPRFPFRLSNTAQTAGQLAHNRYAILLRSAFIDTARGLELPIPDALRAGSNCGSYIVQSRVPLDAAYRFGLERSGATIVSYIPNNAWLVRASTSAIGRISTLPETQAVLPYHPYYKLAPALLEEMAAGSSSAGAISADAKQTVSVVSLNVLLFPDARGESLPALQSMGAQVAGEQSSPFGQVLQVRASPTILSDLAALPGVEEIEPVSMRIAANDLSRVLLGVAPAVDTPTNYLGLTGSNVLINVNDFGFDTNQPDLQGRLFFDAPPSGIDTNAHGTHIAGIIAGSGSESATISNVPGSGPVSAAFQFRGKASGAGLFAIALESSPTYGGDVYLQQTAARTNAFISNNSWNYVGDSQYDLAAASFDAATRDALPGVPGSQPLLFVFAAGNAGHGRDDGSGGTEDSILSPATAKNVLTIGAIEQPRFLTNETWSCTNSVCLTNTPWLGLTDSSNEVASFSSRGNCGVGSEGDFGRFKPDLVAPGTFILSTRSEQWDQNGYYAQTNDWFDQVPDENYSEVLSNLNGAAGPYYRFESGTSLAAAAVSGTLALMQEFFEQRLGRTNSPALMKALLINGARSLSNQYGFEVHAITNLQGWGLLNLPNSLPPALTNGVASTSGIFLFDQNAASALATGQGQTRFVSLSAEAQAQPLRVTLVWTDPPGNPVASVKLVNDLDLVVTNLATGEIYFGNDIPDGSSFNSAWDTNLAPNPDVVNNVENVFLSPHPGANYSISVIGRHVNVNAVTAQPDAVLQDYALVITSGDGTSTDALTLANGPMIAPSEPAVAVLTNNFLADAIDSGTAVVHQRVGAEAPAIATNTIPLPSMANAWLTIGSSNQWRFYVVTNDNGFTNASFFTFQPQTVSASQVSSVAALAPYSSNGTRLEADIDLYVSSDPALLALDPGAIAAADKSLGRGGFETITYSNAAPALYYIGVKSECQEAADYGFAAVFSQLPFSQSDALNNQLLRGFPAPALVPGGSPSIPGAASVFAIAGSPVPIRRVIVTNTLSAPALGALKGALIGGSVGSVVLNNFSTNGVVGNQSFVYDDSGEGDLPGGQPPDGPGGLRQFAGQTSPASWRLSLLDTNQPATSDNLAIFLEAQPDLTSGIMPTLVPGACRQDYLYLPLTATNLMLNAAMLSGSGPISLQVCPAEMAPAACPNLLLSSGTPNGVLPVDATSHPPINPGLYVVRSCNLGPDAVDISLIASLGYAPFPPPRFAIISTNSTPLLDDAVSTASLYVTNMGPVASISVGVRIDHPRVSDLVLHLVSPNGTRVLLDENRGGASPDGMGCEAVMTNITPVSFSGGPDAVTNLFDVEQNAGTILINYDFYSLPDDMRVYYETNLLFDSGLVSYTGATNLSFGPGTSTVITVVMNEGGNTNANTAWFYKLTSTRLEPVYLTFTENTNLTTTPIKFAPTPLTNITYTSFSDPTNGIFYLPEESLNRFLGQPAAGQWTLEIADTRAGATDPPPQLLSWQLLLRVKSTVPPPVPLVPGPGWNNLIGPGQVQWFSVSTPPWISFASNVLLSASAPVNLLFNQNTPPTGTNAGDVFLLTGSTAGSYVLATNGSPALVPGAVYFLGVQNTNSTTVTVSMAVGFDVPNVVTLLSGVPFANNNSGPLGAADYYEYVVSTNAVRAQFEIDAPTADLSLVVRKDLPLPSLGSYDYLSANPGTNEELIVVFNYSAPVPLTPGDWYLGVINANGGPTAYSVTATEFQAYGTNLLITSQAATPTNLCLTWTNTLFGVHYFIQGKVALTDPKWSAVSPTIVANDVVASYCVTLPSPYHFFRIAEGLVLGFPPPVIANITANTSGVWLQWNAAPNNQFNIEWSPSLAPAAWQAFTNLITSTNTSFSFRDDGSQSGGLGQTRYYRLSQLPSP